MIHSWKLPVLAMAAVLGYAGFFCPACSGSGAETPASASAGGAGEAVVEYDPAKVSPERMVEAVEAIGFHPTPRSSGGASR